MFIKRNRSRQKGKTYRSVLLIQGKRVRGKRPAGRPAAGSPPPKSVVVHETLANLSKLPAPLISIIETFCKTGRGPTLKSPSVLPPATGPVEMGPAYGVLAGLHALARELGVVEAVGESSRLQRLALFLIYARVAHQGSRLSAARWSEDHAVDEILRVGHFDEDDLYAALDYLEQEQPRIEETLQVRSPVPSSRAVFLYDVTSVYFEGQHNELAEFGYNRDGKKGKKQMVVGLLTDAQGEPLTIQLYRGNTADPPTFLDAVRTLKARFGGQEIALVGDRGMIKRMGKEALGEARFHYVTALTDPQVRALLKRGVVQLELFEETPVEVEVGGKRLILRCNPATREREQSRRTDQWRCVKDRITARNQAMEQKPRLKADTSLRQAQALVKKYRLDSWVTVALEGRQVVWREDTAAREAAAQLDGCYVIETDLPMEAVTTEQAHERYLDLTRVERDFRTLKTGLLEIRPVFVRKAQRTRGHAVVSLLALKLARELDRRVAPLGLTVEDAIERLGGVRLVRLGDAEWGLWRLADRYPVTQQEVLDVLPKLPAPMLSLGKANRNRLKNLRQGRS